MNKENISFVDYCYEIHKELSSGKSTALQEKKSFSISSFSQISPKISEEKLQKIFKQNIENTINKYIAEFSSELVEYRKLKEVNFYENSISLYLTFIILWCIDNKVNLSKDSLNNICHYVFVGTVGYRLIDLQQDHNLLETKSIYLGLYLINISEMLLAEIFPVKENVSIIKKYSNLYNKTEYKEKQNRWKGCPFSWNNVDELGHKAAPVFSIFELIFKFVGFDDKKTLSLLGALNKVVASTQLCDDISDALEDLSNGFETLVMSGFYCEHPERHDINTKTVGEFINSNRLKIFYEKNMDLLNEASKIFSKYDEYLFVFLLEAHKARFLEGFEINN
ncbi:MAG: hypothetical protein MUF28_10200 [Ignavibacterium sp.]|jgi:uncharacterized protein YaaR (DUF327 family)|nr:hypothetical protein [Ignavibacterium sp.]